MAYPRTYTRGQKAAKAGLTVSALGKFAFGGNLSKTGAAFDRINKDAEARNERAWKAWDRDMSRAEDAVDDAQLAVRKSKHGDRRAAKDALRDAEKDLARTRRAQPRG